MGDLLKSLSGGWTYLVSWVAPSLIFWAVFGVFLLPSLDQWPVLTEVARADATTTGLVLVGASLVSGVLLNALSTVMYRLLEGYYLRDGWLWRRLRARQNAKRRRLKRRLREYEQPRPDEKGKRAREPIRAGLLVEQLNRYPADPRQTGPTAFANALRAFETYGLDRFCLDSQTFWSELLAAAPENLRAEEDAARTPVNFFVSVVFMSGATALLSFAVLLFGDGSTAVLVVGLAAVVAAPASYRLAVLNTRSWAGVVQAVVNLGRVGLARQYGLCLPRRLEDERDMWNRLSWFTSGPFSTRFQADLDSYRVEQLPSD